MAPLQCQPLLLSLKFQVRFDALKSKAGLLVKSIKKPTLKMKMASKIKTDSKMKMNTKIKNNLKQDLVFQCQTSIRLKVVVK